MAKHELSSFVQHYLASTVVAALDFVPILVDAKIFRYSGPRGIVRGGQMPLPNQRQ